MDDLMNELLADPNIFLGKPLMSIENDAISILIKKKKQKRK